MTSRQQFEARYPIPTGVERSEEGGHYQPVGGKYTQGFSIHKYEVHVAFWGVWTASREDVVVVMPEPELPSITAEESLEMDPDEHDYLESRAGAQYATWRRCKEAIESAGLRVSP